MSARSSKLDCVTENDLHKLGYLGRGAFATCQLCSLKSDQSGTKLVLKELHSSTREEISVIHKKWIEKRLMREVETIHKLGQEREEFVKVLWLYIKDGIFCGYGMELCNHGSLRQFIKRMELDLVTPQSKEQLFPFLTAKWMLQVADGFAYLQARTSGTLLHLDLALDNLLITESLDVKIADFGLAKGITDSIATEQSLQLEQRRTIERRVPEKYDDLMRQPDMFYDRYLYGICVVEAFSKQSLRLVIGSQADKYMQMVRDGRHLEQFERLLDDRCFNAINDEDEQLKKLQATVKQVVRAAAHQVPEERATFDTISEWWRDCDTMRMEAERLRVMEMLRNDVTSDEGHLASNVATVDTSRTGCDAPSVDVAFRDEATSDTTSSSVKPAPKLLSLPYEQPTHEEFFGQCKFQLTNWFYGDEEDEDCSRDTPGSTDYGDNEYDDRDYLHDY